MSNSQHISGGANALKSKTGANEPNLERGDSTDTGANRLEANVPWGESTGYQLVYTPSCG